VPFVTAEHLTLPPDGGRVAEVAVNDVGTKQAQDSTDPSAFMNSDGCYTHDAPSSVIKRRIAEDGTALCACCETALPSIRGRGRPRLTCDGCRQKRRDELLARYEITKAKNRKEQRAVARAQRRLDAMAKEQHTSTDGHLPSARGFALPNEPQPASTNPAAVPTAAPSAAPLESDSGTVVGAATDRPKGRRSTTTLSGDKIEFLTKYTLREHLEMKALYGLITELHAVTTVHPKPSEMYSNNAAYAFNEVAERLITWREHMRGITAEPGQ
jgi:hypothetical protein